MEPMDALELAIYKCGSIAELARRVGVAAPAIHQWSRVPAERVLSVSEATKWEVTPHQLRGDLYPNEMDGLPIDCV